MKSIKETPETDYNNQLKEIKLFLETNASEEAINAIKKFVPGAQKIYGVKNPLLNELAKKYKQVGYKLTAMLWKMVPMKKKCWQQNYWEKLNRWMQLKHLCLLKLFQMM